MSMCSFRNGGRLLTARFMGGVRGAVSTGGNSTGVCSGGAGGGVCVIAPKVATTAFLSPCTTCSTSVPMCWAFLSRWKLSAASMFLGRCSVSDSWRVFLPLFSSTTGAGRSLTVSTCPALLFDCPSLGGFTTASSDFFSFSPASSWVCSFSLSLPSTAMPRVRTGRALEAKYCATLLLPTAPSSAAAAAAAALAAAFPRAAAPRPRLRLCGSFTGSFLAGFFTSGTGCGGGPLPSFFSAAAPSASSCAACSAVMSSGSLIQVPLRMRYMRSPPMPTTGPGAGLLAAAAGVRAASLLRSAFASSGMGERRHGGVKDELLQLERGDAAGPDVRSQVLADFEQRPAESGRGVGMPRTFLARNRPQCRMRLDHGTAAVERQLTVERLELLGRVGLVFPAVDEELVGRRLLLADLARLALLGGLANNGRKQHGCKERDGRRDRRHPRHLTIEAGEERDDELDRKSTRLNSSH